MRLPSKGVRATTFPPPVIYTHRSCRTTSQVVIRWAARGSCGRDRSPNGSTASSPSHARPTWPHRARGCINGWHAQWHAVACSQLASLVRTDSQTGGPHPTAYPLNGHTGHAFTGTPSPNPTTHITPRAGKLAENLHTADYVIAACILQWRPDGNSYILFPTTCQSSV